MQKVIEKYPLLSLFVVFAAILLVHLDVPPLSIMEARNFITAREMIESGNWIFPTLNGEPRYEKPPFPTWATAIAGLIFGLKQLYWLRLPAAFMVFFIAFIAYFFSLAFKLSKTHSLRNALITLTSFYILVIFSEAPWDIFAHGFMFGGIYFLFRFFTEEKKVWFHSFLAALFIGFSMLSKGPVPIYVLLIPFLIAFVISHKFQIKGKLIPLILLISCSLIIGGSWYFYIWLNDTEHLIEITTRESNNWSNYNVKPFYYYWNFFIQSGIWTIPAFVSLMYPFMLKKVQHNKHYKLTFWWTIVSVLLLSFIPEKKVRYVMPALLPLALNTGFYLEYIIKNYKTINSTFQKAIATSTFAIIAIVALVLPLALYFFLKDSVLENFGYYGLFCLVLISISGILINQLKQRNVVNAFYTTIVFIATIFILGMPIITTKNTTPNKISELSLFEKKNNIKLYSIRELTTFNANQRDYYSPEFLWYYGKNIPNIYNSDILELPDESEFGLLLLDKDVTKVQKNLAPQYDFKFVDRYNLNPPNKKKERLIRQFYLVSKK